MRRARLGRTKHNSGLTLIEIILSLALLGILAVSFLPIFTGGFVVINAMGNLSRASAEAQEIIDRVYARVQFSGLEMAKIEPIIENIIDVQTAGSYEDFSGNPSAINSENTDTRVRYIVSEATGGDVFLTAGKKLTVLTVRVYYHNFKRNVEISAPLVR